MGERGRVRGEFQIFLVRDFFIKMEKKAWRLHYQIVPLMIANDL
jgi:hypothetical protein